MIYATIREAGGRYFVQLADEPAPRGPFRSRDRAERALGNATALVARSARPQREKPERPAPRVVVDVGEGESRHERRRQSAKNKRARRKMLKVVKKAIVSPAQDTSPAATDPSAPLASSSGVAGQPTEDAERSQ